MLYNSKLDLSFQPLTDAHADGLLPIWSDEAVIRFTNISAPCTLQEVRDKICILKEFDTFAVLQNEAVLGIIGCPCVDREKGIYGVFYQLHKAVWGKGIATASAEWLLDYMTRKYEHAILLADVIADNIASEKILQKLGFALMDEQSSERNGVSYKMHCYQKVL